MDDFLLPLVYAIKFSLANMISVEFFNKIVIIVNSIYNYILINIK